MDFFFGIVNRGERSSAVLAWLMFLGTVSPVPSVLAADDGWREEMIADAMLAAPPSVTQNAKIELCQITNMSPSRVRITVGVSGRDGKFSGLSPSDRYPSARPGPARVPASP
jgi:hypothetical protein